MMILFYLLFLQGADWGQLIQSLGFTIVVAGALLYFAFRVWQYTTKKLDEKDVLIATMIEREENSRTQLVETQEQITETQNRIIDTQNQIVKLIESLKK